MKIYICCSKHFYDRIPDIKKELERAEHKIILPNSYEDPFKEEEVKKRSLEEHVQWKQAMMKQHEPKVKESNAILVLNFEKKGQANYIDGATGINPTILNGDLTKIN